MATIHKFRHRFENAEDCENGEICHFFIVARIAEISNFNTLEELESTKPI
jgi:hypothetical protein